ncbi:MAG: hypothetical protein MUF30_04710 [Burkholderiales bacterium]|jgi:spore coat polysaccharide biosynthesis predicted glycosyltransferase SpsG|nr:hypothetical protein [Burkholderiales bacterium]
MRCIALAESLRVAGIEPVFAMRQTTDLVRDALDVRGMRCVDLGAYGGGACAESEDAAATVDACKRLGDVRMVVVDSYTLGAVWCGSVRSSDRRVVVIDDLHDRDLDADLVMNTAPHVSPAAYSGRVARGTPLLLGPRFALLRREFEGRRGAARDVDVVSDRVLVFYGGGDIEAVTDTTIDVLTRHPRRPARIEAIGATVGSATEESTAMTGVRRHRLADGLAALASTCTVAFGAAGVSAIERLYLGLPAACACMAENQRPSLDWLEQHGLVLRLDRVDTDSITRAADALLAGASRKWFAAAAADGLFGDATFPTRRVAAAIQELTCT